MQSTKHKGRGGVSSLLYLLISIYSILFRPIYLLFKCGGLRPPYLYENTKLSLNSYIIITLNNALYGV